MRYRLIALFSAVLSAAFCTAALAEEAKSDVKAPVVEVGLEDAPEELERLGRPKGTAHWRKIKPEGAKHWPAYPDF